MKLVGWEGSWPAGSTVAWGTPVLLDGDLLVNPTTGREVPAEELSDLVAAGHVTLLPRPSPLGVELPADESRTTVTLVVVRRDSDLAEFFLIDTGRMGGLIAHDQQDQIQFYLFVSARSFDAYRTEIAQRVLDGALQSQTLEKSSSEVVMAALALYPGSGILHALRVAQADEARRGFAKVIADASLRNDTQRTQYAEMLDALMDVNLDFVMKYKNGVAEGGGFDCDIAATTLRAVSDVHGAIEPILLDRYPFLGGSLPAPRFRMMLAASAELHLASKVEGEPLRTRVARHLVLKSLHELLRGNRRQPWAETGKSHEVERALQRIVQPSKETILLHGLGSATPEAVLPEQQMKGGIVRTVEFSVLGFQSGLIRDAARIEITISPGVRLLIPTDMKHGEPPRGVEFVRNEADVLRRAAVFTLYRESDSYGREAYVLSAIDFLERGSEFRVTAFPSSVLANSFLLPPEPFTVRRLDDDVHTDLGVLNGVADRTLSAAAKWLRQYDEYCSEFELRSANRDGFSVIRPTQMANASALQRIIVSLEQLGGQAPLAELVAEINARFRVTVRTNNTRREVYRHPQLLEFDPEDGKVMRLTRAGRAYVSCYVRAGGDRGD